MLQMTIDAVDAEPQVSLPKVPVSTRPLGMLHGRDYGIAVVMPHHKESLKLRAKASGWNPIDGGDSEDSAVSTSDSLESTEEPKWTVGDQPHYLRAREIWEHPTRCFPPNLGCLPC